MKHARADYQRIQDPEGKIPEDEPVFLLRGQDMMAPRTVRFWARAVREFLRAPHAPIAVLAEEQAAAMERWQAEHHAKLPNLPIDYAFPPNPECAVGKVAYPTEGVSWAFNPSTGFRSACRWWKNGDHPGDLAHEGGVVRHEGQVVRYFRHPTVPELERHDDDRYRSRIGWCYGGATCGAAYHVHGWIDEGPGGRMVCPGDYVLTTMEGAHFACHPSRFNEIVEALERGAYFEPGVGLVERPKAKPVPPHVQAQTLPSAPVVQPTAPIESALSLVREECARARATFGPYASAHEGYAVILEELDELWREVCRKDRDHDALRKEAVQVAATAVMFLAEVCAPDPKP